MEDDVLSLIVSTVTQAVSVFFPLIIVRKGGDTTSHDLINHKWAEIATL